MNLIELHILQSFPVTCLNRDDVGAPKTAVFGGVSRARVSSQSWKRAIRVMAKELQPNQFAGKRTRLVVQEFEKLYRAKNYSENAAKELALATAKAFGTIDIAKGNAKTLLFFSPQEMGNVADRVLEQKNREEVVKDVLDAHAEFERALQDAAAKGKKEVSASDNAKEAVKKATEKLEKARDQLAKLAEKPSKSLKDAVKDAADIAVFGRMVADDHTLTVEGAGLFSHALSTHAASNEIDFFSAVDDEKDAGTAHISTLEFSSACYYRYIGVNLDLLRDASKPKEVKGHLRELSDTEFQTVLDTFLRSCILAVPGARKNSMFGISPPEFVLGLRRTGQPLSLVNAFETPVRTPSVGGFLKPSIEALNKHHQALDETYGLKAQVEMTLPKAKLDDLLATLIQQPSANES